MKKQTNRKAIVISAVLTALILTVAGSAVFAANRLSGGQPAGAGISGSQAPVVVTVQPALNGGQQQAILGRSETVAGAAVAADAQVIAAYQAQLEHAYKALDEAYAQVGALQAAQSQPAAQGFGESEEHEHGSPVVSAFREFDHD